MPRIRREGIPQPLMAHLIRRVRQREISTSQLGLLAGWLASDPAVPESRWFKRFSEMIVCGPFVNHDIGVCGRFRIRLTVDHAAWQFRHFDYKLSSSLLQ